MQERNLDNETLVMVEGFGMIEREKCRQEVLSFLDAALINVKAGKHEEAERLIAAARPWIAALRGNKV